MWEKIKNFLNKGAGAFLGFVYSPWFMPRRHTARVLNKLALKQKIWRHKAKQCLATRTRNKKQAFKKRLEVFSCLFIQFSLVACRPFVALGVYVGSFLYELFYRGPVTGFRRGARAVLSDPNEMPLVLGQEIEKLSADEQRLRTPFLGKHLLMLMLGFGVVAAIVFTALAATGTFYILPFISHSAFFTPVLNFMTWISVPLKWLSAKLFLQPIAGWLVAHLHLSVIMNWFAVHATLINTCVVSFFGTCVFVQLWHAALYAVSHIVVIVLNTVVDLVKDIIGLFKIIGLVCRDAYGSLKTHGIKSSFKALGKKIKSAWLHKHLVLQYLRRISTVRNLLRLTDQALGVFSGLIIYSVVKPVYAFLHCVEQLDRSNRQLYRWFMFKVTQRYHPRGHFESIDVNERSVKTVLKGIPIVLGMVVVLVINTIVRVCALPFQMIISLLAAPRQAIRHGMKYGLAHTVSYSRYYQRAHGKGFVNVYYFNARTILIASLLVGLCVGVASVIVLSLGLMAPLSVISAKIGVNLIALFNLAQASALAVNVATFFVSAVSAMLTTLVTAGAVALINMGLKHVVSMLARIKRTVLGVVANGKFIVRELHHSAKQALELVRSKNALVAQISSNEKSDTSWKYWFGMIRTPMDKRPVKALQKTARREEYFDFRIGQWTFRIPKKNRGGRGDKPYIKKTSTSLLPKKGNMQLFELGGKHRDGEKHYFTVGFLFDVRQCLISYYNFVKNVVTNTKGWIKGQEDEWLDKLQQVGLIKSNKTSYTLDELRDLSARRLAKGNVPSHNEILARISKASVKVVYCYKDANKKEDVTNGPTGLLDRVNAIRRRFDAFFEIGLALPIVILSNDISTPARAYLVHEWLVDLYVQWQRVQEKRDKGKATIDQIAKMYGNSDQFGFRQFLNNFIDENNINLELAYQYLLDKFPNKATSMTNIDLKRETFKAFISGDKDAQIKITPEAYERQDEQHYTSEKYFAPVLGV